MLTFHAPARATTRWDSQNVEVGVKDRGVYLVEAVRGELRAYTILMVSDLVMITKTGSGRIVNFLADRNTGEPVRGAELFLLTRDARKDKAESDANGLAELKPPAEAQDDLRLVARSGANFAVNTLAGYAFESSPRTVDGLHLHRPPGLPPRPHRALQGHPAAARRRGYIVPAGKTARGGRFRTPSRSPSTRRRSPPTPTARSATTSNCPPARRWATTRSRSTPAKRAS